MVRIAFEVRDTFNRAIMEEIDGVDRLTHGKLLGNETQSLCGQSWRQNITFSIGPRSWIICTQFYPDTDSVKIFV